MKLQFLFAVLATGGLCAAAPTAAPSTRPDVLFLVLEDVSPERFGAYGNPVCQTPNIERLAAQGMRFDNFYTTPPCCPARTSMMTGLRPESTRVLDNSDAKLAKQVFDRVVTLPEQFLKAGYETVRVSKFAHDDKFACWTRIAHRGEGGDGDESGKKKQGKPEGKPAQGPHAAPGARFTGAPFLYGPTGLKDEQENDSLVAGTAISVLREKRDKPLFLAVGFHTDHLAFRAPDKYFDLYPADKMVIPQNPGAQPDGLPTKKILNKIRKESGFNAMGYNNPSTLAQWREAIAAQYACLTFADVQIGRILDALEKTGRAQQTIVLLWSDHGFMLGEHFFWRKGQLYNPSCKSAFFIKAPGVAQAGRVCRRLVETVDLYPTLLELCGLPAASHVEGLSFVPLLRNSEQPWKKATLVYREKGKAIGLVTEHWRYNQFQDQPERNELYDHQADPGENRNLVKDPQHAALIKGLGDMIKAGWKGCLP